MDGPNPYPDFEIYGFTQVREVYDLLNHITLRLESFILDAVENGGGEQDDQTYHQITEAFMMSHNLLLRITQNPFVATIVPWLQNHTEISRESASYQRAIGEAFVIAVRLSRSQSTRKECDSLHQAMLKADRENTKSALSSLQVLVEDYKSLIPKYIFPGTREYQLYYRVGRHRCWILTWLNYFATYRNYVKETMQRAKADLHKDFTEIRRVLDDPAVSSLDI